VNTFELYFNLGLNHILDIAGIDHILFVLVLCAPFTAQDWRRVLIMVTSFTLGHSITLALATLSLIQVDADWIEFLIPVTIALSALINIYQPSAGKRNFSWHYIFGALFGLIHGLGFSNYLKSLLSKESDLMEPLFAFNVGLEAGQLVIVISYFILLFILQKAFKVKQRDASLVLSSLILGISIMFMFDKKIW
jgi:hypothetical protein